MKKNQIFALLLACVIVFTTPSTASAVQGENIEGTAFSAEVQDTQCLETVNNYFTMRRDAVNMRNVPISLSETDFGQAQDALMRAETMRSFWEEWGVYIVSVETELRDYQVMETEEDGTVQIGVYEWTWINYNGKDETEEPTDRMGFGTTHLLTCVASGDGGYVVIKDVSGDSEMSHYGSDICVYTQSDAEAETEVLDSNVQTEGQGMMPQVVTFLENSKGMPNLDACIEYADTWAKSRNTTQYFSSTADCANFVSQCIAAGGFVNDPRNNADQNCYNDSTQWFFHRGTNLYDSSPKTWRVVGSFFNYWGARYEEEALQTEVGTDGIKRITNLYPGNPVCLKNKSHVVICTGYDSDGRPYINGHTDDQYHFVITAGTGSGNYGTTVKILSGYCANGKHTANTESYRSNIYGHWHNCSVCNTGATPITSHTNVYNNEVYTCTVCGYQNEFALS